jgi:hypothetical protein
MNEGVDDEADDDDEDEEKCVPCRVRVPPPPCASEASSSMSLTAASTFSARSLLTCLSDTHQHVSPRISHSHKRSAKRGGWERTHIHAHARTSERTGGDADRGSWCSEECSDHEWRPQHQTAAESTCPRHTESNASPMHDTFISKGGVSYRVLC